MDRQIKFRAKQLHGVRKGAWWYGYFSKDATGTAYITTLDGIDTAIVDESTLGQFTGLLDKNGKEVYEGDMCRIMMRRKYGHEKDGLSRPLGPVEFSRISVREESLYVFDTFNIKGKSLHYLASMELEVIGNIHELSEVPN
ncbi:YopX family protein [Sphingobacterium sp. 2149]|uniref:YopX family protein n=1 Tax=Sphingobacterium sp. 2149 TaxID=2817763 RepID=UPI002862B93C|nr:YopX family protein [Sphingobacterium sp. 2149]MDR6734208.1 putative phage protein (TIGR01671 family) [Sphingobacterium sp. 2149]